jgi:hypothetical protein
VLQFHDDAFKEGPNDNVPISTTKLLLETPPRHPIKGKFPRPHLAPLCETPTIAPHAMEHLKSTTVLRKKYNKIKGEKILIK